MERNAAISYGSSSFLLERLMKASDGYQTVFCKTCGTFAVFDCRTNVYKPCRLCGETKEFGRATIPYAFKLLIHLLAAPGLNLRLEFLTSDEYLERTLYGENGQNIEDIEDITQQLEEVDSTLEEEQINEQEPDTDYLAIYD